MTHCPICGDAIADHTVKKLGECVGSLGVERTTADLKQAIADAKAAADGA